MAPGGRPCLPVIRSESRVLRRKVGLDANLPRARPAPHTPLAWLVEDIVGCPRSGRTGLILPSLLQWVQRATHSRHFCTVSCDAVALSSDERTSVERGRPSASITPQGQPSLPCSLETHWLCYIVLWQFGGIFQGKKKSFFLFLDFFVSSAESHISSICILFHFFPLTIYLKMTSQVICSFSTPRSSAPDTNAAEVSGLILGNRSSFGLITHILMSWNMFRQRN